MRNKEFDAKQNELSAANQQLNKIQADYNDQTTKLSDANKTIADYDARLRKAQDEVSDLKAKADKLLPMLTI